MVSRQRWGVFFGWPGACSLIFAAALVVGSRPLQAGTVIVQPIQVCDSTGAHCGDPSEQLYSTITNAIWAQAGITVDFLTWETVDILNTVSTVGDGSFGIETSDNLNDLFTPAENNLLLKTPPTYAGNQVISMWFVGAIDFCGSAGSAYGCGEVGGNEIAIANNVFTYNSGAGRMDTIAHEMGHNLGLSHCSDPGGLCNTPNYDSLMDGGGDRVIPTSISDISPAGSDDNLSTAERAIADSSPLDRDQVPEPGTVLLTGIGILGFVIRRRRAA
jgi:hypothetical protein